MMSLTKCHCSKCNCPHGTENLLCRQCMENNHQVTLRGNKEPINEK